jgi:hypothetical protein
MPWRENEGLRVTISLTAVLACLNSTAAEAVELSAAQTHREHIRKSSVLRSARDYFPRPDHAGKQKPFLPQLPFL